MLTTGDLSELFQVTSQTVINWLEEGRIPFERIGRGPRRVSEQAALRYIEESGLSVETLNPSAYAALLKAAGSPGNIPLPPVVIVLNADALVISWNEGAANLFGYLSKEMLGRPVDRLLTEVEGKVGGVEYHIRSQWPAQHLFLKTSHKDRNGNTVTGELTVSRIYSGADGKKAGYLLYFVPGE